MMNIIFVNLQVAFQRSRAAAPPRMKMASRLGQGDFSGVLGRFNLSGVPRYPSAEGDFSEESSSSRQLAFSLFRPACFSVLTLNSPLTRSTPVKRQLGQAPGANTSVPSDKHRTDCTGASNIEMRHTIPVRRKSNSNLRFPHYQANE